MLTDRGAAEQLLHGEPHPWNVLTTKNGLLFIDFENCARGPVEFDLAWVPNEVSERYRDADQELVGECRTLVLALIAAHRWRRDDQHPRGRQSGVAFLNVLGGSAVAGSRCHSSVAASRRNRETVALGREMHRSRRKR